MEIYKIYPVPAADASTAFQVELDPRAITATEALERSGAQGTEREEILQEHLCVQVLLLLSLIHISEPTRPY